MIIDPPAHRELVERVRTRVTLLSLVRLDRSYQRCVFDEEKNVTLSTQFVCHDVP